MSAALERLIIAVGLMRELRDQVTKGIQAMPGPELATAEGCVEELSEIVGELEVAVSAAVEGSAIWPEGPIPFEMVGGLN